MDVKLKRPKRFSLPATLAAFAVGVIAALGVLWVADRPSPGSDSGATAATATSPTTRTTPRRADTVTGAQTEGRSASTESVVTPSSPPPALRLVGFDSRLDGANTALVWELSAPLGGAAVTAETAGGVTVRVGKVNGALKASVDGADLDPSAVISYPTAAGSSVEFSMPTKAFGDLPVEIIPGVIPEGASDVVTGEPVTLG